MNYGILASGNCLLTDIIDQLHEPSRKINIVDRLSRHLAKGTPKDALKAYLTQVKKWCPEQPVIHINDKEIRKLFVQNRKESIDMDLVKSSGGLSIWFKESIRIIRDV